MPNIIKFPDNAASNYNRGQNGVFGLHPAMTPKYAVNAGLRDAEYRDSLARMFLSLSGASAQVKQAYLKSVAGLGDDVLALAKVLIGSMAGPHGGTGFIDFILSQVQEQFQEKYQVSEVLGDSYVAYFFGQAAPVFSYSGFLINSFQDDQRIGMALAYQHLLRGTQCARRGSLLRLRYDSVIVSGTVLNMSQAINAENEVAVPFSFQMLVKEYIVAVKPALATTKVQTSFFDSTEETDIGGVQTARVRTTMFVPDRLAAASVVGQDTAQVPTADPNAPRQTNLENKAQMPQTTPLSDVRGTPAGAVQIPANVRFS